jgi:hypothetical protein
MGHPSERAGIRWPDPDGQTTSVRTASSSHPVAAFSRRVRRGGRCRRPRYRREPRLAQRLAAYSRRVGQFPRRLPAPLTGAGATRMTSSVTNTSRRSAAFRSDANRTPRLLDGGVSVPSRSDIVGLEGFMSPGREGTFQMLLPLVEPFSRVGVIGMEEEDRHSVGLVGGCRWPTVRWRRSETRLGGREVDRCHRRGAYGTL